MGRNSSRNKIQSESPLAFGAPTVLRELSKSDGFGNFNIQQLALSSRVCLVMKLGWQPQMKIIFPRKNYESHMFEYSQEIS